MRRHRALTWSGAFRCVVDGSFAARSAGLDCRNNTVGVLQTHTHVTRVSGFTRVLMRICGTTSVRVLTRTHAGLDGAAPSRGGVGQRPR